jgi:hypothetical protein
MTAAVRLNRGAPPMNQRIQVALARGVSYNDIALLLNIPAKYVRDVRYRSGLPDRGHEPITRPLPEAGCVCRVCHYWHGGDCDSPLAAQMHDVELLSTGPNQKCAAWRARS